MSPYTAAHCCGPFSVACGCFSNSHGLATEAFHAADSQLWAVSPQTRVHVLQSAIGAYP